MGRIERTLAWLVVVALSSWGVVAVAPTIAQADCVLPVSGHWAGSIHSNGFSADFPISSQLSFNANGTMTGSVSISGGYPYPGGNVSGSFNCGGNITFGTVDAIGSFAGTMTASDGSGTWSSSGGDSGTWTASADPYVLDVTQ